MNIGESERFRTIVVAFTVLLIALAPMQMPTSAQAAPAGETATKAPATPDHKAGSPSAATAEPEPKTAPGVPSDATTVTLELPSRLVALTSGKAEWTSGFKSIVGAIEKIKAAIGTAGLAQAGQPFVVFLATDDTSFQFEAMVPIAEKPEGKAELTDAVKIGHSPQGKAIKFLHRGAYDDIDSTYDLITAFLDEKGLDSQNLFIEEYLTETKEADDPNLEADIYVFLK